MSDRRRSVDFGPMSLPVGEELGGQGWGSQGPSADEKDVARFEAILNRGRGGQGHSDALPDVQPGPLADADAAHLADPDDIGAEIAHLWVGTGLHSAREVRVGLREELLPDTSVRLFESEGRLRIEFTCGAIQVADWLDRKLRPLARELGKRLDRNIELSVFLAGGSLVGERTWPEDT